MNRADRQLPEAAYAELVRSLFTTLPPTIIMTIAFVAVGLLADARLADPVLILLFAAGVVASVARIAGVLHNRKRAVPTDLARADARRLELVFGASYISSAYKDAIVFALMIGFLLARPQGLFGERVADRA